MAWRVVVDDEGVRWLRRGARPEDPHWTNEPADAETFASREEADAVAAATYYVPSELVTVDEDGAA
jgi:hypothetical protein